MILNGVCVTWKGWIDLQRLDGMGCLEFDEDRAQVSTLKLDMVLSNLILQIYYFLCTRLDL